MSRDRLRTKYGFYRNAAKQAIPNAAWTPLTFDTNDADTELWHPINSSSTTIASGSNNAQLPQGTIYVASTTGFAVGTAALPGYAVIVGPGTHQAVRVVSTTNIVIGTPFNLENGDTVDGVVLATGDRVLLAGQTTASEKGIYTVPASGAPTRATDMDANSECYVGAGVWCTAGTHAGQRYQCTATGAAPWVPGTSTSTWAQDTTPAETVVKYTGTLTSTTFPSASLGTTWLSTGMTVKAGNVDLTPLSAGLYSCVAEVMWIVDGEKLGLRGVRLVQRTSSFDFTIATQERPSDGLVNEAVSLAGQPVYSAAQIASGAVMRVEAYQSSTSGAVNHILNSSASSTEAPGWGVFLAHPNA